MIMARKSNFAGYIPSFEEDPEALRRAEARGAKRGFEKDVEGMRTKYEVMRQPKEASSKEMARRLGEADEAAAELMQRRHRDYDSMETRERKNMRSAAESTQGAGGGRGRVNAETVKQRGARENDVEQESFSRGGKVGSASKRADGIAMRGKTRGRMV